ncbi:formylglycine-generating enzyme family protein [Reichenbachiella agarivorans]|uniref:Formylglycine-generating enzyme family protein n=1 Tax=Reichenbachiella agarivorans TaxID=2979464 RepID=A0ABY6CSU4_9BACT|nr:formylglycine-generating enzyme family protein [Reichenbachiella agarivorans]UXP32528.1 formylglycine-generating enzyme family protein [Reichenbachiella agarivorans]
MNHCLVALLLVLCSSLSLAQTIHPSSSDPGCCSEKTSLPYTYNPEDNKVLLQLYVTNNSSEKEVFYEGKYDPWKDNKKNHLYEQVYMIPPGSLPISEGKFMDQTEVANIHYQEFLFYITKDSAKYLDKEYMPQLDNKFKSKYFLNPEFYFYPVVGVTHQNAQAYCEWRAKVLNVGLKDMLKNQVKKYKYAGRLPSEEEWKKIAGNVEEEVNSRLYNFGKKEWSFFEEDIVANRFAPSSILSRVDYEGYTQNFLVQDPMSLDIEIPFYIYSFSHNTLGFYNFYGNVKELVAEGYAIGGSFQTSFSADELFDHDEVQAYRTDVGFRCLTEIARRR